MVEQIRVQGPSAGIKGELMIPGDKSISHRAVLLGALTEGTVEISGFLPGADCLSSVSCLRQMGVEIEETGPGALKVHGRGWQGLKEPSDVLDVGNSGTTMRLLLGILAGTDFFSVLTGDASIRRRPMGRVTEPLQKMGARIQGRSQGKLAPLAIQGGKLVGCQHLSAVASAQVKSALLLAGLRAEGKTEVQEPAVSRDHTERMLRTFGVEIGQEGNRLWVEGGQKLQAVPVQVPGDISSAAFWLVAASIIPNSSLYLKQVGVNPTRTGILDVLQAMGARIQLMNYRRFGDEPVADLLVESAELQGVEIGGELIPRLIDEIPVLALAAAVARGRTIIRDAAELRVKESDRLAAISRELSKLGATIEEMPDGLIIEGGAKLVGARVESYHDHRMAMTLLIAGLVAHGTTTVSGCEAIPVSYPDFVSSLQRLGANLD
ncbi:3-phosphoshikimate 1-carboxyvinyltransferase [Carboxydocella thermautotrophica]|nr:3-phosphoshikimate 1-carboxyvinyltransferase [Carboxydocella thermautotrophica]